MTSNHEAHRSSDSHRTLLEATLRAPRQEVGVSDHVHRGQLRQLVGLGMDPPKRLHVLQQVAHLAFDYA